MEDRFLKLWAIPQVKWIERRKFTVELISNMEKEGLIKVVPCENSFLNLYNIFAFSFNYKNESYYFFEQRIARSGQAPLIEFFQLEKKVTHIDGIEMKNLSSSTIIIGSDDDRQNTYYPLLAMAELKL
jgi:hypothetical protein